MGAPRLRGAPREIDPAWARGPPKGGHATQGGVPTPKAKYYYTPIEHKYREGKLK